MLAENLLEEYIAPIKNCCCRKFSMLHDIGTIIMHYDGCCQGFTSILDYIKCTVGHINKNIIWYLFSMRAKRKHLLYVKCYMFIDLMQANIH